MKRMFENEIPFKAERLTVENFKSQVLDSNLSLYGCFQLMTKFGASYTLIGTLLPSDDSAKFSGIGIDDSGDIFIAGTQDEDAKTSIGIDLANKTWTVEPKLWLDALARKSQ